MKFSLHEGKRVALSLLSVFFLFLLIACGGSAPKVSGSRSSSTTTGSTGFGDQNSFGNEPPVLQGKPSLNVVLLASDESVSAKLVGETLYLSGKFPRIKVGQIIVDRRGMGIARKVVEVTSSTPTSMVLKTEQATLEELYTSLKLGFRSVLTSDHISRFEPGFPGVTLTPLKATPDFQFRLDLPDSVIAERDNKKLYVKGGVMLRAELNLGFAVENGSMQFARVSTKLRTEGSLGIHGDLDLYEKSIRLGTIYGEPIVIFVGWLPIVFTPEFSVYLKSKGTLSAKLGVESKPDGEVELGVEYSGGTPRFIHEVHSNVESDPGVSAMVEASVNFDLGLRAEASVKLFGVVGPYVFADAPRFEFSAQPIANPFGVKVEAGVTVVGGAGFKVEALGHRWVDQEFPEILSYHSDFYSHIFPFDDPNGGGSTGNSSGSSSSTGTTTGTSGSSDGSSSGTSSGGSTGESRLYVSESDEAPSEGSFGFYRHGTPGYWHVGVGYGDGNQMLWTYNNDEAHGIDNMGDWRPLIGETRNYEIFVFIPRWYGSTADAQYEIYHADGRTDRHIRQIDYNDEWVSLGTYRFNSGTSGMVRLIDRTSEKYISKWVGFDAMKWEPR